MFGMQHPCWGGNVPVLENESRRGRRHLEYVISHCLPRSREDGHRPALCHGVRDRRALRQQELDGCPIHPQHRGWECK